MNEIKMTIEIEMTLDDSDTQVVRDAIEIMNLKSLFKLVDQRAGLVEIVRLDMPEPAPRGMILTR